MNFRTKISLTKQDNNEIDYSSNILLIGSCFSENIGNKFNYYKFKSTINPFGILFNPKAIETLIRSAVEEKKYTQDDVFYHNEQWHCFEAHSKLSNPSKEDLIRELNEQVNLTAKQLKNSTHIVITLGASWVYKHIKSNKIVANCHKVPQKQFEKKILSVEEIEATLIHILQLIKSINPDASIVFTVSPVRHLKDGFIENQRSKAHLITAIHNVISNEDEKSNYYFPSYEIMMDELRDYRFYNEDMIHPNQLAINYIWGKFKEVWIAENAITTMSKVEEIQKGLAHKPFNPSSDSHQKFLQNLELKKVKLQQDFPHISF